MSESHKTEVHENWERNVFEQIAQDYIKEKKRKRRWGIFYKSIFVLLFLFFIIKLLPGEKFTKAVGKDHTALIDVYGPIFELSRANADNISKSLRQAFSDETTQGIILRISSPGGSAVQSDIIFNEITRLKKSYPDTPVYAVCSDACLSGAYYIASAADEIYANPSSMVGSIGVIYNGFGFVDTLEKLGVERRLTTAGQYKAFLDPFSPENADEEAILQNMLNLVHQQFEKSVQQGRGDRLKGDPNLLFSGLFWTGDEALKLGLIDGFGSAADIARDKINNENIVDYTIKPGYFDRIGMSFGSSMVDNFLDRFGLLSNHRFEYTR